MILLMVYPCIHIIFLLYVYGILDWCQCLGMNVFGLSVCSVGLDHTALFICTDKGQKSTYKKKKI